MYKKNDKKINFRTSTLLKYFSTLGLVRLGRNVPKLADTRKGNKERT